MEDGPSRGSQGNLCCLIDDGIHCTRAAGNASYSKRIQKTVSQRSLMLELDNSAHHTYICDYHKGAIQSARSGCKAKEPEENTEAEKGPDIDLNQLQLNTLRRYKRFFKIPTKPAMNKAQLAETLTNHFKNIPVCEKEVLSFFIYTVKTNANKLDNKAGQSSSGSSTMQE